MTIEVRGNRLPYVSRGGLKLEKAMKEFPLSLTGKICMDVGASTGGFTDCMLQNGALKVYAVDVGHGQLDWKLRNDTRVVCLEKTNIRYATRQEVPEEIAFSSIDVSFISLEKVLPAVRALLSAEGEVIALIKPQFEAGREQVGKHGVVREPKIHVGFVPHGLSFSPIRGPEGNIEYLIWLRTAEESEGAPAVTPESARAVVRAAHETLAGGKA